MGAALPLEQLGGFVERIGEAGGREHDDILCMCRQASAERYQRSDERGDKPCRDPHLVLPIALTATALRIARRRVRSGRTGGKNPGLPPADPPSRPPEKAYDPPAAVQAAD